MPKELSHSFNGATATVRIGGELDSHSAREIIRYVGDVIDLCMPRNLCLDLSGLSFMDSSGLAVVLGSFRKMQELDGTLQVRNVPPQPMKVFRATHLDNLISFEERREQRT